MREKLEAEGMWVSDAYLQFTEPDIIEATRLLESKGAQHITVVPVFLASGTHYTNDFPALAKELEKLHPEMNIVWTDVLGEWDVVLDSLAQAIIYDCSK